MGRTEEPAAKTNYNLELIRKLTQASRSSDEDIDRALTYSLAMDAVMTFKIILWYRRFQKKSAYLYRRMLSQLITYNPSFVIANIHLIPMFGNKDDLLNLVFSSSIATDARRYLKHIDKHPQDNLTNGIILPKNMKPHKWLELIATHEVFSLVNIPLHEGERLV